MCNFPSPLPPPNPQIKKCRHILQFLSVALILISILGVIVRDIFTIITYLLMVFLLYLGWAQFNWCFTLIFFLLSLTNFIGAVIALIGMYL
jgi:VanZ family protein